MNGQSVDVVTIGESMVLLQAMSDGPLQYASLFTKSMAGAESNVAVGLSRLGKRVRWISRVGTDPFGDFLLATLLGEGVDTQYVIRDESAPTAIYFKEFKGVGDPTVYYYRRGSAASRLAPEEVKHEWFAGARHLHVTGITPALGPTTTDAVREAMRLAREQGLSISFDPNLRRKLWSEELARETLLSLIPLCDVFLPGVEEAEFLLGKRTLDEYGQDFLDLGASIVALKLGADGSMAFSRECRVQQPAHPVNRLVDTVGAGDAFAAGFLSVLLDADQPLQQASSECLSAALARANLMGAWATQWKGDWEGLPRITDVTDALVGKATITR